MIAAKRLALRAFRVSSMVWDWSRGSLLVALYTGLRMGCPPERATVGEPEGPGGASFKSFSALPFVQA